MLINKGGFHRAPPTAACSIAQGAFFLWEETSYLSRWWKEGFLLRGGQGSGIDCGCGHRSWKQLLPLLSCSPPSFSFYPTGMPAQGQCGPHLRWVFPPQWDVTKNGLADILRSVSLAWVQIQQNWQPRLTVLVMEKIKLDILGHSINYMKKLYISSVTQGLGKEKRKKKI